jgi:putative transposase
VSAARATTTERRVPSDRDLTDAWLIEKITAIHADNRGVYGRRRMHAELRLGRGRARVR